MARERYNVGLGWEELQAMVGLPGRQGPNFVGDLNHWGCFGLGHLEDLEDVVEVDDVLDARAAGR